MLQSVDGFWIAAKAFGDELYSEPSFHFFEAPGISLYATISLSSVWAHFDKGPVAFAYIKRWATYGADGILVSGNPPPGSSGHEQDAVSLTDCGYLEFALDVSNWTEAIAQINIFRF